MVQRLRARPTTAKLPVLRYTKTGAAVERARPTSRQLRQRKRFQMNITELRQQIHRDLRIQHPEWIQPNGESPMCDSYEARFMEVLDALMRRGSNADVAASDHAIG
jgi:hypothetical protein